MKLIIDIPQALYDRATKGELTEIDSMFICGSTSNGIPLEQEPCEDCISRKETISMLEFMLSNFKDYKEALKEALDKVRNARSVQPKTGHCKECKWWKDSDGAYRRGVRAESQCPINRREVFEGNGYCYMFEPRESEE